VSPATVISRGGKLNQQGDDKDLILSRLPAVGAALEVVAGAAIGFSHSGLGGVGVEALKRRPVPVDDAVIRDIGCHFTEAPAL
jgi:hypothetical protein